MQRWNELLVESFRAAGWSEMRPSYGSILVHDEIDLTFCHATAMNT
jgi:hypothetical protein